MYSPATGGTDRTRREGWITVIISTRPSSGFIESRSQMIRRTNKTREKIALINVNGATPGEPLFATTEGVCEKLFPTRREFLSVK